MARKPRLYGPAVNNKAARNGHSGGNSLALNDETVYSLISFRSRIMDRLLDFKHDIDRECGYPTEMTPELYRRMYDRESFATRVVNIYPEESWASSPEVYETEDKEETEFEKTWNQLLQQKHIWHYMHRIDELSGIGYYGVLLYGINDGKDLSEPVDGIDEDGNMTTDEVEFDPDRLLFLRAFDETLVRIQNFQQDQNSPRYGLPTYYSIRFVDLTTGIPEAVLAAGNVWRRVHWSRVIHVADNRKSGEVFGVPRQRPVFNRLLDIRKILSGSGEMFWKGAFPGYSFEIHPEIASEAEFDDTARNNLRAEFENYSSGLQRYLALLGVSAKSLAPQVASPSDHLRELVQAITIHLGCPLRVFLGSEEAKMASTQDVKTWNKRVSRRQNEYLTPMLIRPFIERMIALRVLPKPKQYHVLWPDLNSMTESDKAAVALTRTQAIAQYVGSGASSLMGPLEFLTIILGLPTEQAMMVLSASGATQESMEATAKQLDDASVENPSSWESGGK